MLFTVVCSIQYVLSTQWSVVNWLFPLIFWSSGIIGSGEESEFIKKSIWVKGLWPHFHYDSPRCRDEDGAEVTDCHGEQDTVGGGPHAGPAQDDDDDSVGHHSDHGQHRHDDPQQREHEHHRAVRGRGVKSVASSVLETPGREETFNVFHSIHFGFFSMHDFMREKKMTVFLPLNVTWRVFKWKVCHSSVSDIWIEHHAGV